MDPTQSVTEWLLTSPGAFGLTTATPVQRAICRAADGAPLGDLACDEGVVRVFGGADAVTHLATEPPKEFYIIAAIRCGKSLFAAALSLKIALTIDLSFLRMQDVARVSVVSIDKDKAGAVMEHLIGALELDGGVLGRYLVRTPKPNGERVRIRRDDGRFVDIVIAAGKRGGSSLVSRWTVAAVFDEGCRMQGQEDGVVNFEDSRKAVIARISVLRGAQLVVVSSPWAARGPVYEAVQQHTGKPTRFLTIVRATGPEMNPVLWTPEACEETRLTDESAYITDVLGEFADAETGLFLAGDLDRATPKRPMVRLHEPGWTYVAAIDPATRRNAFTLVLVAFRAGEPANDGEPEEGSSSGDRYIVATCRQWIPSKLEPLKAKNVLREIADELEPYGVTEVHTDQWGADFIAELGENVGLDIIKDEDPQAKKDARWLDFRRRVIGGQVELSPDPVLRADLLSARKRLTPNGIKIDLPLTRDGRHADYAPAVVLAVDKASQSVVGWVDAMEKMRARETEAALTANAAGVCRCRAGLFTQTRWGAGICDGCGYRVAKASVT